MNHANPEADPVSLPPAKGYALVGGFLALALVAGVSVLAGVLAGDRWFIDPRRFSFSYLTGLMFLASLCTGSLAWLMLHHLTGSVWSIVLRRLLENLTRPLPWIAILFIPVVLNLDRIYPWADRARLSADPELSRKAIWLNPSLVTARSAVYLVSWALLAWLLSRQSGRQDRSAGPAQNRRMTATSAWGLVLLALTTSFAAADWLMSLDPHWSSTIFGVYFWISSLLGSLAALVLVVLGFRSAGWLRNTITIEHLHDLGKLLFSFVIFWAYVAFCQYFLIWYADFPEESHWYATRARGVWNSVSWSLVLGRFVVPFILLLFRSTKRSPLWLGFIALWILAFHYIDFYWLIMPALGAEGAKPHWLDVSLLLAMVFFGGAIVARACQAQPLVPIGDPRLAESRAFRNF
jgi:hypothetical protein